MRMRQWLFLKHGEGRAGGRLWEEARQELLGLARECFLYPEAGSGHTSLGSFPRTPRALDPRLQLETGQYWTKSESCKSENLPSFSQGKS